jgi:hypothetical protein
LRAGLSPAEGISQDEPAASLYIDKGATARALRRMATNAAGTPRHEKNQGVD